MADFDNELNIMGFDPTQLSVFNEEPQVRHSNPLIYHTRPADAKSKDHVYRATIKIIYSPFDLRHSILEQQSYALQDNDGYFNIVSSLTNNDTSCPVFKAWKKCRYSDPGTVLWKQQAKKAEGGNELFDKRFARYVTIQVLEDKNNPDLENKYLFWKLPKSIYDLINNKMNPSKESKKTAIPIMDFLFGRSIELEVSPGPGNPGEERYNRETSYSGEISTETVSCKNPDGTSLLSDDEQEVLDTYVASMEKVWKSKDPEITAELLAKVNASSNTVALKKIYSRVMNEIKEFCPDLNKELGYKEWDAEMSKRVQNWIDVVLSGENPAKDAPKAVTSNAKEAESAANDIANEPAAPFVEPEEDDDLPF